MAGGIGSRFWPYSRADHPKQFLDILGVGKTLLQLTLERIRSLLPPENILVVTNATYADLVRQQLPEIIEHNILLEPYRKNTAPCIAYACHKLLSRNSAAQAVLLPSDHFILGEEKFKATLLAALKITERQDIIVTIGVRPTRPDTGYGYIQFLESKQDGDLLKVKTFVEKPPPEMAATFCQSGDFLWNSGIFISNIRTMLNAYQHHLPEVNELFKKGKKVYDTPEEASFIDRTYALCPNVSIDTAIMEKAKNVMVMPATFGWSDLGTWVSLYEAYAKDYWGNAVKGKNVMIYDAHNCMIMVPAEKLVVVEGLEDFIVVDTHDALLICRKNQEQRIKEIVMDIKLKTGDRFL